MAYPQHNTTHVATGLSRLVSGYVNAPKLQALITSYLKEIQAAEDAIWQTLTLRNIAIGVGDQLDQIGKIVGQPRAGLDDVGFRLAIGIRVLADQSQGRTVDIIKIAQALAVNFTADLNGQVQYREAPPMAFTVGIWNQTHPEIATSLFTHARGAGTRGIMEYSTWSDGHDFGYASTYDGLQGQLGFGSTYDTSVGGLQISARAV